MKKLNLLKTMLLLCALIAGSGMTWATTYKLTKVTTTSGIVAGNKYVFERNSRVFNNTVSSSSLQTTNSYAKSGLTGTESYVWTLETATNGFYMKNVSLDNSQYLYNSSGTSVSFGSKNSIWKFEFTDGVALISNTSNSNRFLGETGNNSNVYKAYAVSNLSTYGHDITVYVLEEELDITSLSVKSAPTKTRYEVGETLDMTGFSLDADGLTVTSGYTMTIGGSDMENGGTLNSVGKKTLVISYGGKTVEQAISVGSVTSIVVTTPPTKTTYDPEDEFDATGMVVEASLSTGEAISPDEWTKVVTTYTVTPDVLAGNETYVTISYEGQTTTQAITVSHTEVTGVELNKSSLTVTCGDTGESLSATVSPVDATVKTVTWTSSNESVATVDENGYVTGEAVGTATITATTVDMGKTATCEVTVTADESKPSLVETVFEEYFTNVTKSNNTVASVDDFDNEGWTKTGSVYCNGGNGLKLATGSNSGTVTTPTLTGLKTGATLSFYALGWDQDEKEISVSGTNCSLSEDSFTDLPYPDNSFAKKTATITVTGSNPTITFTAAKGYRVMIDDITITQPKTSVDVTLNAYGFASYCSPFALDLTPTTDYAAYAVKPIGENKVKFTKIAGKVAASTAFILYNADKASEAVSLPIIEDDDEAIAAVSDNALIGTLSPTYVSAPDGCTNFGLKDSKFVPMSAGVVKKNKAYLQVSDADITTDAGARGLEIVFDEGEATGIKAIDNGQLTMDNVYDLSGRKIVNGKSVNGNLQRGLYIVNGKKVVVR